MDEMRSHARQRSTCDEVPEVLARGEGLLLDQYAPGVNSIRYRAVLLRAALDYIFPVGPDRLPRFDLEEIPSVQSLIEESEQAFGLQWLGMGWATERKGSTRTNLSSKFRAELKKLSWRSA